MTNKEAIEWLQSMCCGDCTDDWANCTAYDANICNPRKAVNMAIESLEKQEPKKPVEEQFKTFYKCPVCDRYASIGSRKFDYCSYCGQAIDWEEEDDE